jgi:hypothetical protein
VQKIRIDADAASPKAVRRRRGRGQRVVLFNVKIPFSVAFHIRVALQMHSDRDDGLEALGARHVWDARPMLLFGWVDDEHTQAHECMAEENGNGEEDQDEEDVDFLANVAVCEGDCEVCFTLSAWVRVVGKDNWGTYI